PAPALQAIAAAAGAHLEPGRVRADRPRAEADGPTLEREEAVLADGADAVSEIRLLRARAALEQLQERSLQGPRQAWFALPRKREQVGAGARIELLQQRQDPRADQAALGIGVRAVASVVEPDGLAVRLGLLAP